MKRVRTGIVLLWANTVPKRMGFLMKVTETEGKLKFSVIAIRMGEKNVERCRRLGWSMETELWLIWKLYKYCDDKHGATLSGELAKAVEDAFRNGILLRIP